MGDFPAAVARLKPLPIQTQQDFLDLFDRLLPNHYIEPLKTPGPGYEYLQGVAEMMARVSEAISHVGTGNYILSATGGSYATATVEFYRGTFVYGAVTVRAGTRVRTAYGYAYETIGDVVFGATDLGPHAVTVRAINKGWVWNLPGQFTRPNGEVVPGSIERISVPLMDPPYGDPTMQVRQTTDATGGANAMLDGLGHDRGILRQPGESDDQYRPRIVFIPETVTPDAVRNAAEYYLRPFLQPVGKDYSYFETWQPQYQTAYDFPVNVTLTDPFGAPYNSNVFVYDDPRPPPPGPPPVFHRYMDEIDYRGAIVIGVPRLPCVADYGLVYDDTAMNAAAFLTPLGKRAITAYDVTGTTSATVLQGAYDGGDQRMLAIYGGLGAVLEKTKAAGISIEILMEG